MTGIFGILHSAPPGGIADELEEMAAPLRRFAWTSADLCTHESERIALGRIRNGVFNAVRHPTRATSQRHGGPLILAMSGELYAWRSTADPLLVQQARVEEWSDEQSVLQAWQRYGSDFVHHVDGAFIIAVADVNAGLTYLINDRSGLYPTYITRARGGIYFAPQVKSLLRILPDSPQLRAESVAEFVFLQRLLGSKTFFTGIDQLPPASIGCYDHATGEWTITCYWNVGTDAGTCTFRNRAEAVEEGVAVYRNAVHRRAKGHHRFGIFLSGGLDSRSILGFLSEARAHDTEPIHTFTFGVKHSLDMDYANKLARLRKTRHHAFAVDNGAWVADLADLHVELTEGFHSWPHVHGLHMLPQVRELADVNFSGVGDILWGGDQFCPDYLIQAPDDIAFTSLLFTAYNQRYSWPGLTYAEERSLYTDAYRDQVHGLAYESFAQEVSRFSHLPIALRLAAFNWENEFARHLLYHGVYGRAYLEYRFPYGDVDLMNYCHALPHEFNVDYSMQRSIISKAFPDLARIPDSDDRLPVSASNMEQHAWRFVHMVQDFSHKVFRKGKPQQSRAPMEYEKWLRTDLFGWAEKILLDKRTTQRGLFDEQAMRSLLRRVHAGTQPALVGKVSQLITFEMMLRSLVDGEAAPLAYSVTDEHFAAVPFGEHV